MRWPPNRPVTFVFNGGPGAASAFLHLGLVGPRVLDLGPDSDARVDYPDFGFKLAEAVASGAASVSAITASGDAASSSALALASSSSSSSSAAIGGPSSTSSAPLPKLVKVLNNQLHALSSLDEKCEQLEARVRALPGAAAVAAAAAAQAASRGGGGDVGQYGYGFA